ncbi:hypothetical protein [Anaeromicropila herbilytica]|uniref:Uncharacterized protein n=1 Tax=Anaeromicropila herbilytica TaxID=2785025 RepID=A0A7R7EP34_9FIRM|nr:hypothetical protein [Anaeromicropila herbilytica]BCN32367.1 hypothetical protein bsdtb5_36620 [Anaeromicropila herbilytica]
MSEQSFTIIKDTFGKEGSDETVEGLTVIIDGKIKEVFDTILRKCPNYNSYTDLMSEIIVNGINKIIDDIGKIQ